jgi:hypothetical protein
MSPRRAAPAATRANAHANANANADQATTVRNGPKTAMAVCAATLVGQQIPDFNFT